MMSHLPFENWIFNRENLTSDQIAELEAHLKSCQHCNRIQSGWSEVEQLLQKPPLTPAPPQFVNRFQASLAQRKALQQKRQIRAVFIGLGSAFVLLSIAFIVRLLWIIPPAQLLSDMIGWVALAPQRWSEIQYIFFYWAGQIPPLALMVFVFLLAGWSTLLLGLWFLTLQRLSHLGVHEQ
ncbi:hypothetical protein [Bellilinea sp.]|jgi:hypothetical protein|uniref:Zinc-finger domain-containing protein n=1 Tax=Bellilinea caldifistulae TaxID=360411 RepID=A0A7C4Q1D8_9CHLR|nr:hypothetical protein [Bellilinea sp.]